MPFSAAVPTTVLAGVLTLFSCNSKSNDGTLSYGSQSPYRSQSPASFEEHLTPCYLRLSDVREGRVTPQQYVASLEQCLPEVQRSKEKGILHHLLYEPTEEILEQELRDLFSQPERSEEQLSSLVQREKEDYHRSKNSLTFSLILPRILSEHYKKQLPGSMVLTYALFSSPWIIGEEDLRGLLGNGLQNLTDMYEGLPVSPDPAAQRDSEKISIDPELLSLFMGLHASYKELEEQFLHKIELGRFSCSDAWFTHEANRYYQTWQSLRKYPVDRVECGIRGEQFQAHKDILPAVEKDILSLRFQLFGRDETISLPLLNGTLSKKE